MDSQHGPPEFSVFQQCSRSRLPPRLSSRLITFSTRRPSPLNPRSRSLAPATPLFTQMNRGKGKRAATSSCPLISNLALEAQEELSGESLEAEYLETSTLSPPKKRKIKKRSQVWQHFGEIYVADGIEVTDCNHCKTRVRCGSKKAGTSSLWHHVNNNCSASRQVNQPTIDQYQSKFTFDASSGTGLGNIRLNKLETKKIRRSLAEFLIEDELPFMLVQKSGFRKYSKLLEPRFNMISRHTVATDCLGVYVAEKDLLKNLFRQLSPRVCLTTDTWTSKTCTAHLFFQELFNIRVELDTFMQSSDEFLSQMATRMNEKYLKYWGEFMNEDPALRFNRFLLVATILEPKCKLQWFEFFLQQIMSLEDATNAVELAKETVEGLFAEYNSLYGTSSSSTSQVGSSGTSGRNPKIQAWKEMIRTTQFSKQSELEEYLSEGPEDPDSPCTVLDWWKVKQNKFPVLARMARDILAIPVSTVASESAFSTGGRVLNVFRSSLAPKTLESLICAQDWTKGKEEVLLHCNETEDVETYNLDKALEANPNALTEGILINNEEDASN